MRNPLSFVFKNISMKYVLLILTVSIIFISCANDSPRSQTENISRGQLAIDSLLGRYEYLRDHAANSMAKDDIRVAFLDTMNHFLSDSLKFIMANFKLNVRNISKTNLGDLIAFNASFRDSYKHDHSLWNAEYWMEFDYPKDSAKKIDDNPAYQLLKNIPDNSDTVFSLFYLGEVKWNDVYDDRLSIRVVPFPNNFNFDSARSTRKKL